MKYIIYMLITFFFVATAFAEQSFRVMDKDFKNKGIECEIKIKKKNGKLEYVSYTNKDGYTQVEFQCDKLDKVIFIPKSDYYSKTFNCPIKKKEIFLSSITYQRNLIANAEHNFSIGDYGSSAFAFSEAAARLRKHDKNASMAAAVKAYKATGKVFGVETSVVFDPLQAKQVISPELGKAIKKYQQEIGLEVTGELDFRTLKSVSKTELPAMLFSSPDI
ncbi:MAG: peptidoglycan-binding protein [Desulfobacteraceae bacterium]|nr:peptidoglycan-binding protein [Desulfobacteraceae bacterium]